MCANAYQQLDYEKLYGANPFSEKKKEIEDLISLLREKMPQKQPDPFSGVDDPEVQNYMSSTLGSQRKLLYDYVKAAAGAGLKRGGFNVMGGPRLDSSLTYSALQNLAKDYANRLKAALKYGADMADAKTQQYDNYMLDLQKLLGLQKGYLAEEADWKEKLAQAIRQDLQKQTQWMREDQAAKTRADANQTKYDADRIRAETDLKKFQEEINRKLQDQAAWERLMKKARLIDSVGQFGAGWSSADDMLLKRLNSQ